MDRGDGSCQRWVSKSAMIKTRLQKDPVGSRGGGLQAKVAAGRQVKGL